MQPAEDTDTPRKQKKKSFLAQTPQLSEQLFHILQRTCQRHLSNRKFSEDFLFTEKLAAFSTTPHVLTRFAPLILMAWRDQSLPPTYVHCTVVDEYFSSHQPYVADVTQKQQDWHELAQNLIPAWTIRSCQKRTIDERECSLTLRWIWLSVECTRNEVRGKSCITGMDSFLSKSWGKR